MHGPTGTPMFELARDRQRSDERDESKGVSSYQ